MYPAVGPAASGDEVSAALVITVGDDAGQSSTSEDFKCYDLSWGAFKSRTYTAIGKRCTMAIWHRPFFTSVTRTVQLPRLRPWWKVLHDGRADLVLNGHNHGYERFAKLTPAGVVDPFVLYLPASFRLHL
jgi:hypothetical protein